MIESTGQREGRVVIEVIGTMNRDSSVADLFTQSGQPLRERLKVRGIHS